MVQVEPLVLAVMEDIVEHLEAGCLDFWMLSVPLGMVMRRTSPMSPGQELFGSFTLLHNITTFFLEVAPGSHVQRANTVLQE